MPRIPAPLPLLLLLLFAPSTARAQDVPAAWRGVWPFMVQAVCDDASGRLLSAATPLDGPAACPYPRKLRLAERLPYHKRDWPGIEDRATHPDGYQQSDSVPAQIALGPALGPTLGPAAIQTFDFGDAPRRFGTFDAGDGGQAVFFGPETVSVGVTEDGGAGLQLFLGPGCAPVDSWVLADASFPATPAGTALARITRNRDRCPGRLGYAATRWRLQPVRFRFAAHGQAGTAELSTLVTDHFGGRTVDAAPSMERMYFTRELGLTRWERWENLSRDDRPAARQMAAQIAASGRCDPGLGDPNLDQPNLGDPAAQSRWRMTDCREWTRLVPPADPAGDPPTFWLDRLRTAPETRAIFAP